MKYSSPLDVNPTKKAVRDCIARFDETGRSGPHSPMGGILCHIMNHCIQDHIPFQLRYLPGGGYDLERKDWLHKTVLGVPHDEYDHCSICRRELNTGHVLAVDCGGDCRQCMAEAGDPDCIDSIIDYFKEFK